MSALPTSGDQIGPCQVTAVLGFTGLGGVFSAFHTGQQTDVALAVLQPELVGNDDARRQFFAEARELAKVRHENLVEVYDLVDDGPHRYFTFELLRGLPLSEVVRRSGRLPLATSLHIAWQLCQGLRAAHETGLVHRALRMDSVFFVERGGVGDVVKILGFHPGSPLGIEAAWPGLAPEQWRDEFIDHRADFYAFGALLYELTTGRRPLAGTTADELRANHERKSVVPPSTFAPMMPGALDALIEQCLAKDPEDRPYMIQEIEAALREIATQVPPSPQGLGSADGAGVAIPGQKGWTVVAVPVRGAAWQTSPPAATEAADAEALDEADFAALEDAEPVALATPWPSQPPAPAPAAVAAALAAEVGASAAFASVNPAAVNPFGNTAPPIDKDVLAEIAGAVDDALDDAFGAPAAAAAPAAAEPAPTSSVFDLFSDAPLESAPAPAPAFTPTFAPAPVSSIAPAPPPAPAVFDLVEPAAPVLDLVEEAPAAPLFEEPLAPPPAAAPLFAAPLAPAPTPSPPPPAPAPDVQPALRPAMSPRGPVITAVPKPATTAGDEAVASATMAPVEPAATAPEPSTPAPAPSFFPEAAPLDVAAPSFQPPAPFAANDTPAPRSKALLAVAAAAAVVVIVGGALLLRGGGDDSGDTVAIQTPAPPAPDVAPPPAPPAPPPVEAVVDAGTAAEPAADPAVEPASEPAADAGVAVAALTPPTPAPNTPTGDDLIGFPDEPGQAPPPPPTVAPTPVKPAMTKPATTKPATAKPATKPVATKPPPAPQPKPAPKPTPKPVPTKKPDGGLKDGGLVNPFKR